MRPDVVVMDVRMPGMDGVTATRALTRAEDAPPVLVLTTFDEEEILAGSIRAGASGFLLKGRPPRTCSAPSVPSPTAAPGSTPPSPAGC